jgi:hypothetical protein
MVVEHTGQELTGAHALLLGNYLIAQDVADQEPRGDCFRRMQTALTCLGDELREVAPEFFVVGQDPELVSLLAEWKKADGIKFLIELRVSEPFSPYEFTVTGRRDEIRLWSMRRIARVALGLDAESADVVVSAWNDVKNAERRYLQRVALRKRLRSPKSWAAIIGVGLAVGGAAVIAGPAIAPLMPAAAGLSGAAATSAGLAQLGFGAIAAGGLGMAGGLWVLGIGGAALGIAGATTATLLSRPGGAVLLGDEVRKLLVSAELVHQGVLDESLSDIALAISTISEEVDDVRHAEESRNEEGARRLDEIRLLQERLDFAQSYIQGLRAP